ncbi:MAG TPA: tryptophan synthase subunit alpha, partial [Firmicutes bacterium]|nr:tryptophan synthase subunit alpha [Bacillota bacterium]
MSNLTHVFANGRALIPFITAGDPNLTTTEQLIAQMARAGADLIELGIPFSDST